VHGLDWWLGRFVVVPVVCAVVVTGWLAVGDWCLRGVHRLRVCVVGEAAGTTATGLFVDGVVGGVVTVVVLVFSVAVVAGVAGVFSWWTAVVTTATSTTFYLK